MYFRVQGIFMPALSCAVAVQLVYGLADRVLQQVQLARDEMRVLGVTGPGRDIDHIKRLVDALHDPHEFRDQDATRWVARRESEAVPGPASRGRKTGHSHLHVLEMSWAGMARWV